MLPAYISYVSLRISAKCLPVISFFGLTNVRRPHQQSRFSISNSTSETVHRVGCNFLALEGTLLGPYYVMILWFLVTRGRKGCGFFQVNQR